MKVNVTQFRSKLSALLEEEEVQITRDGKVIGVYTKGPKKSVIKKSMYISKPEDIHFTGKAIEESMKLQSNSNYACGCKRGSTKLCPKHHRI